MDNEAYTAGTGTVILSVSRLLNRMPVAGAATLEQRYGITVHAKTTIVDDHWAVIGWPTACAAACTPTWSARSGSPTPAPARRSGYRALLWSQHFQLPSPAPINDLPTALKVWSDSWGPAGPSAIVRPGTVQEILLPLPPAQLSSQQKEEIDTITDPDSRQTWGYLGLAWDNWRAARSGGGSP